MRLKRYIGFKYLGHIDHNKEFRFYPKGNVGPLKGFKKENNMIKFLVYKNILQCRESIGEEARPEAWRPITKGFFQ